MKKQLASFTASAVATLFSLCASAALTINSPADYSTVYTLSEQITNDLNNTSTLLKYSTYSAEGTTYRKTAASAYWDNSLPVTLSWTGDAANYTVKLWRSRDLAVNLNADPVFVTNTTAKSVAYYDPEVGRNYTWSVSDGTDTVTSHFFAANTGPRIIYTDDETEGWGEYSSNGIRLWIGRDLGGWKTSSGKVVRQGAIYRSAYLDYCAGRVTVSDTEKYRLPLYYLRDVLGIKFEIDLREKYGDDGTTEKYVSKYDAPTWIRSTYLAASNACVTAGGTAAQAHTAGVDAAALLSSIGEGIPRFNSENACGVNFWDYAEAVNGSSDDDITADEARSAMWHTFTNFFNEANYPVIFHCQYGKDRTGTLAAVILGLLGVDKEDINVDYALSWYAWDSDHYTMTSWRLDNFFTAINTEFPTSTYTTLSAQMEAYLKSCATAAGVTDLSSVDSSIAAFKTRMLEEPETAATAPVADPDALAITAPADYSTVSTMNDSFRSFIMSDAMLLTSTFSTGSTADRQSYANWYNTSSIPVTLAWNGPEGAEFKVNVYRTREYAAGAAKPVFSVVTTARSAVFYDPETGRNYTWTVDDGTSLVAGRFYTQGNTPRIIYSDQNGPDVTGIDCLNGRDIGGWTTTDGKVVRQGMIYRSAELEPCQPTNSIGMKVEMPHLKNNLGIKLEVDLRKVDEINNAYMNVPQYSCPWKAIDVSCISPDIPRFNAQAVANESFPSYEDAIPDAATTSTSEKEERMAMWCAFTNFCDEAKLPAIFHCAHGKDRAGTVGYLLLGVLGVSADDAKRDFGLSWCYYVDESMDDNYGYTPIDTAVTMLPTYGGDTLAEQCYNYFVACAGDAGVDEATAKAKIDTFRTLMLEDPETAAQAPANTGAVASLEASAAYSTYPAKFVVEGAVGVGAGATTVTLYYALNDGSYEPVDVALEADGTFAYDVPYTSAADTLKWYVRADSVYNGVTSSLQTDTVTTARAADTAAVVYTWTGAGGDGKWANIANWSADSATAFGYPDSANATASFTAAAAGAEIDLEGATREAVPVFAENAGEITMKNGALTVPAITAVIGAAGTTLTLDTDASLDVSGAVKVLGTCKIIIPEGGREAPLTAGSISYETSCTFNLDLTDYSSAGSITLARFNTALTALPSVTPVYTVAGETVADRGTLAPSADYKSLVYTQTAKSGTIDVPAASENLVYTGSELTGVPAGEGYTLAGVAAASDVGSYTATVTLKSGYTWTDGTTDSKTLGWSIAKADNAWAVEPAISLATWKAGEEGGVLTPGVAKFGTVTATIAKDGGAAQPFDGTLPTEMGSYTITYTASAESTANYNAIDEAVKTVEFSITADPDDLVVVVNYETHPEPYFVISGIVTPGSGTTTVKINYALNSATAGNTVEVPLNDDGTFVYQIPYTEASDYLTWNVEVSSSDGGSVASEVVKTERVIDYASTVYLWTGSAGDNRWKNVRNWYADVELCYGYPGEPSTYWGHSSYMKFTASTDAAGIDLEDDSFTFIDNGAIILAEGIYVKFRNGAMTFMSGKMMNDLTAGLVGKPNSTLVFEDVTLKHANAEETLNITPYTKSTLIFEGNTTATWIYKPLNTYTGTKFIVRNGTLSGNSISSSSTFASDYVVEISNGVWSVSGNVSTGIAPKVVFRDGKDREAQFITSGSLKLYGTYDIVIPAKGRTLPAVQAKTLSGTSSSVIKLDVTDYTSSARVPLVKFTSTTAQSTPASTLAVYADGEDVTSTRSGAKLVFEDNVLYYVQDDQNPAESVPVDKPTAVTSYTYDGTAKTIATATDAYTVSGVASASEPGVYTATLTLNPGYTWADGSTDPLVIVWSISKFDADHTIICYGDSLTTGTGSTTTNMDSRANYFDGRLSGVDLKPGYPYWLSELLPSNYNVIHQARGSAQACNIMSWSGEEEVVVAKAFTLPSMGGSVVVSTNFVFKNCAWGPYGGWASIGSVEIGNDYESYYGFATPIYPLYENYDASTTADSITGTLAGRRVRLQGDLPHAITVTALDGGAAVEIAAGTDFIPDSASDARFTDAIRIYCIGGNDSNCSDDGGSTTYDTYIKGLAEKIKSRGGRYLIVSPSVDCNLPLNETNFKSSEATDFEAKMAAEFGDKFLNLRLKMIESAKETATELGVSYNDAWYDGWDGNGDGLMAVYVHYNTKGYKVMAEFIRQKLVALGYIDDDPAEEEPEEPGEGGGEGETPTVAVDPSWGYVVEAPGGAANEYAVVFTNHTATAMQWTAPAALQNVQFLVVGGGGGGGADTSHASAEGGTGGGGGGGGGVVTGLVNFAKGSVINVTVGNGGSGGKKDVATRNITFVGNDGETYKAYGDSGKAGDSYFSVGGNEYVKAYAGGGDLGAKLETDSVSNVAEDGGSGSGARWKYRWGDADVQSSATKGFALDDTSLIPYYQTFGNRGGKNLVNYSAAGGGGATTAGGNTTSEFDATRASGIGGEGLTSSITGTAVVYGSGGGGGNGVSSSRTDLGKGVGAKGGTGAGDGNQTVDGAGTSAKANQGGGGGGGGYHNNGGSGGSGIVVFRFYLEASEEEPEVVVPGETWATLPAISTNVFTKGAAITLTPGTCDNRTVTANYTAGEIAALDPGTYTYRNVASADGVDDLVYELDFLVLPADFTAAKTIICYGDSITAGDNSTWSALGEDSRYFDGRMNGKTMADNYPRFLSTMLPEGYNVIAQSKSQQWSDTILAWAGGVDVVTRNMLTLPASGSTVWAPTNLVFTAANPYGIDGGLQYVRDIQYPNDQTNYFAGAQMPDLPALETRPDPAGSASSMTGWLGDKRVRVYGKTAHPAITGKTSADYGPDQEWARISAGGSAVEIPAGTRFVPDTAYVYNDAIAVLFAGTNDEMGKEYWPTSDPKDHADYIGAIADTVAKIPSGRYVAVSTMSPGQRSDEIEAAYSAAFGEHHLNMYKMMELYGLKVAVKLGLMTESEAAATTWQAGLMGDSVHPNKNGYNVVAYILNEKLIELEYVEGTRDYDIAFNFIAKPACTESFVYDGSVKTCIAAGDAYTLEGTPSATEVGEYTVAVKPNSGYAWEDGSTEAFTVSWNIVAASPSGVAIKPSWGYIIDGVGGNDDEYAIVFTNHLDKAMTWTAPVELKNVQFLVVGGGGGGGADVSTSDEISAGAGGGGGGVVTGLVNLAKGCNITVSVGNGGLGGVAAQQGVKVTSFHEDARYQIANPYGNVKSLSENSSFAINSSTAVIAYGGGGDQGAQQKNYWEANVGGDGGSGAGTRVWADDAPGTICSRATRGYVNSELSEVVCTETFGEAGGTHGGYSFVSGGGGGATQAGAGGTSFFTGGIGGQGLESDITGEIRVYGSGGGGGAVSSDTAAKGGAGGTGAGNGNEGPGKDGCSALANQGGGGGGGGGTADGGNGGSGIVVFRFSLSDTPDEPVIIPVEKPVAVADLVYNGNVLTGVVESNGYTLEDNTAIDAGEYTATATLADGYIWADGSTDPVKIAWSIAKAENTWTTAPSISKTTWEEGVAGEITYSLGAAASGGTVVPSVTKDGVAFTPDFTDFDSWKVGEYVITLTVAESDNYNELTMRVTVTVTEPVIVLPDPVLGTVTTPIASADGKTPWGYVISGLGEFRNETAVVFTNENATGISWTVPAAYNDVRFLVVGGGGGGGGDTRGDDAANAGAGGGGGGVVTGLVNVASGDTIAVTVGAGGLGGIAGTKGVSYTFKYNGSSYTAYGNVKSYATDSIFNVNGVEYVRAYAGGGDMGGKENSDYIAAVGDNGGSGAGTRPWADGTSSATKGAIGADASGMVSYQTFGNAGGPGIQQYSSGGGGGASPNGDGAGLGGIDMYSGGKGGEGLACDITGSLLVYGSGGGGGNALSIGYGGLAGTGAGNGNYLSKADGDDALANQGGGGGGGGGQADGGNGGSGIVVFRYTDTATGTIFADEVAAKLVAQPYTGEDQTCALAETMAYTVAGEAGNEPGTYTVTVTPKAGYVWETGTNEAIDFNWTIIQSANAWVVEPSISKETWVAGEAAGELVAGVSARFGDFVVTIYDVAADDEAVFDGTLPTAVGDYIITYSVAGTDAYTALSKEIAFEITGTALTAVEKPVVSYPSLTKFEAGITAKPAVTPAASEAYTVTYETDFTSAGEHTLVIELNEGYKWSDDTIAPLEYTYLFVEREFNTYYWGTTDRWWNDYRSVNSAAWFVDAARTVKASTTTFEVDSYDAYVIADIPSGIHGQMGKNGLHPKLGRLVMSGELELEGGSMWFKNETVTPVPYIVIGANSTLTAYPANFYSAEGCGYIDIGAGSLFFSKRAVADENVFIRFNTENAEGATLEVSRCDTVSEYGWFDGGTVDSTPVIRVAASEYGALKFTNPDAVSGVAGPLALDLGFKSGGNSGMTLVEVAGTLNIQPGSTLALNAGSLAAGTYSVLKAGVLNDNADLVRNGTITGLASGTYGTLVRSGNQIDLVITTAGPTVAGTAVAPAVVFKTARASKPITYPCTPSIAGEEGAQTITWGGVTVDVPSYYKLVLDGNVVTMTIRDEAKPVIATVKDADGNVTAEAIKIEGGKVKIHLENTRSALYYAILSAVSLGDDATWAPYDPSVTEPRYERGESDFEFDATDAVRFFKADVKDEE